MLKLINDLQKKYPAIYLKGRKTSKIAEDFLDYCGIKEEHKERIVLTAMLVEINKIFIQKKIIEKKEKGIFLGNNEEKLYQESTEKAVHYLKNNIKDLNKIEIDSIESINESWNGVGPKKLKREEIPASAYILKICSKIEKPVEESIKEIENQVDPYWLDLFRKFIKNKENLAKVEEILMMQ